MKGTSRNENALIAAEKAGDQVRLVPSKNVHEKLELSSGARIDYRMREIQSLLWLPNGMSHEEVRMRLTRAVELYEGPDRANAGEAMLAQQIVGTHAAAMDCLRRAMHKDHTFKGRNAALNHASKLMTLYEKQLRTLHKSKGKGQKKVTLEHVHVEAGGQAIVGNVEAGSSSVANRGSSLAPHSPDPRSEPQDAVAPAKIEQAAD